MHQIILYEDRNGISPVEKYLKELDVQNTKDARILIAIKNKGRKRRRGK